MSDEKEQLELEMYQIIVNGLGKFYSAELPIMSGSRVTIREPRRHTTIENVRTRQATRQAIECYEVVCPEIITMNTPVFVLKCGEIPEWFTRNKSDFTSHPAAQVVQPAAVPPAGVGMPNRPQSAGSDPAETEADNYVSNITAGLPRVG